MRLGPGPVPEPPHVVVLVGEEAVRVVAAVLVVAEATAEDSSRFAPWQRAAEAAHHLLLRAHVARAGAAHRASLGPRTDSGRARDCGRRPSGARERVRRPGRQGSAQVEALQRKARRKAKGAEARGEDGAPGDPVARCAGAEAGVRAGTQSGVGAASSPPPPRHHATTGEARWIFEALACARYHCAGPQDPSLGGCVLHRRQAEWSPLGLINKYSI